MLMARGKRVGVRWPVRGREDGDGREHEEAQQLTGHSDVQKMSFYRSFTMNGREKERALESEGDKENEKTMRAGRRKRCQDVQMVGFTLDA